MTGSWVLVGTYYSALNGQYRFAVRRTWWSKHVVGMSHLASERHLTSYNVSREPFLDVNILFCVRMYACDLFAAFNK
jgi:hypothetical protein